MNVTPSLPLCKAVPLPQYIEDKIDMLKKDFYINLKKHELEHIRELESEISVDQYVRYLYKKYL